MESLKRDRTSLKFYAVMALTVLAPLMGGATKLWAQAFLALCTGILFLLLPPGKSLGLVPNLAFVTLLQLASAAFLPANWFSTPEWRIELGKIGVPLPGTMSAQPWLTLESSLVFLLCLAWAYYLLSADWSLPERRRSWFLIGSAIITLAATLTVSFVLKKQIPFWPNVPEFGFFPNRNHTSNVLGLGGIIIYAAAMRGLDEGRKTWWIWIAALTLVCWALIIDGSRAGIILLGGGVLALHLSWLAMSEYKRRPLIASGMILCLLALFAWDGGKTAMRFGRETAGFFSPSQNTRLLFYRDAINFSLGTPIAGIGLGNFSATFNTKQHDFLATNIAGHPESDWLWSAVELGWLAPLLIGLLFGWWAKRCFPFERGTLRLMRLAAFISVSGFALHAFFDVPGHQIGALWPALFLASTATHPQIRYHQSRVALIAFRFLGIFFIAAGAWWFASILGAKVLPTTVSLRQSVYEIDSAAAKEDYQTMLEGASKALKIAPLNWELYFKRGFAEAALYHPRAETLRDFSAARYLLPNWTDLYVKEGQLWLGVGEPDLAFDVWQEGMERMPIEAPHLYGEIFTLIKSDSSLRERWRDLAHSNKDCAMIFLQNASPAEFQIELDRLLVDDPELRSFMPADLKRIFRWWYERADKLALAETLQKHSEWQKIAWPDLARLYADYQDYRQAYETVVRFSSRPRFAKTDPAESIESLGRRFKISGNIENDGLPIALAQANAGDLDNALATLKVLSVMPGAPRSLHFVEAEIWARKGEWKKAWQAILKYEPGL